MLMALIHLTLMGREGLKEAAGQNVSLMAYFLAEVTEVEGFAPRFTGPRFNEVALRCPLPAQEMLAIAREAGFLAGLELGQYDPALDDTILVAITETKAKKHIDALVAALHAPFKEEEPEDEADPIEYVQREQARKERG
jgi:glycine dehydrogenase subunit 1